MGGGMIGKRPTYKLIRDTLSSFDPTWLCNQLPKIGNQAHGYIFCSKDLVPAYGKFFQDMKWGWDILVYAKANPLPTKNFKYLTDTEFIMFYREPNKCYFNNDLPYENYYKVKKVVCKPSQFGHPTPKNLGVIKNLLLVSTRPGDLVLDLYSGSHTTLLAAKELGRRAIGVETSLEYCSIIKRRLNQSVFDFE
jgi:DNA modification methylase